MHISTNYQIACLTCRYGKTNCDHVQHLLGFVRSESDLPDDLKLFSQAVSQTSVPRPKKCYPDLTCLSKQKIPFVLPPELSAVLSMPPVERFLTGSNNVAKLVPDASVPCSECFKMSWSEPYLSCTSLIVTERQLLQAHGMQKMIIIYVCDVHVTLLYIVLSQKCTTVQCTGCLHYDGRGQCLLNNYEAYDIFI